QHGRMVAEHQDHGRPGHRSVTHPDIGGHDGLVFVNESEVTNRFWMRDTPMPLTIAFFDGDHRMIETVDMEPCPDDLADAECPTHGIDSPHVLALEIAGRSPDELLLEEGARIELTDRDCPEQLAGR